MTLTIDIRLSSEHRKLRRHYPRSAPIPRAGGKQHAERTSAGEFAASGRGEFANYESCSLENLLASHGGEFAGLAPRFLSFYHSTHIAIGADRE